jgi:hypothetical protein
VPSVTPTHEVIRLISQVRGKFVAWVGAGLSRDAGIMVGSEICDKIRDYLSAAAGQDRETWEQDIDWNDPTRRYGNCVNKIGAPAVRLDYFRNHIIQGAKPSFNHHAIALLMQRGYLRRSCLTTNFDKLIEMAFAQQAISEFQAIRSEAEKSFWIEEDKHYVVKLHGDYDTGNILNTEEEVTTSFGGIRTGIFCGSASIGESSWATTDRPG